MTLPGKKSFILIVIVLLVGGVMIWQLARGQKQHTAYRSVGITRGDLLVSISATGTVEPEEVIDVGAQVAGQILSFGKDAKGKTVDYGSEVDAGTILARIDDSLYASDVAQAEATLQSGKANLERAEADLFRTEQEWKRAKKLGPSEALSQSGYDSYESAWKMAKAQVAVNQAAIRQAEAALKRARRNLGYCTITSPVKGIIIDRRVNTGQTVVASLNAPSLFLLAKDLTRIQVWVAVNEADIGKIHPGQPVTFTVDAFPGQTFKGEVSKIRLNAAMTQNVVTYTVEIATDNSDGRLLPYLTANVLFHLQLFENVLQAPNAALRWTPPTDKAAGTTQGQDKKGMKEGKKMSPGQKAANEASPGALWVLDETGKPRSIAVQTGAGDGINTLIEDNEALHEGMQVITGIESPDANKGNESVSTPFAPKFPGSKSSKSPSKSGGR
ncbi:MAG: HlyD family secretion [Desulfobulbaceae bacterium]|nr:MAG: HlyD family secretion [Desulfobulbaceae bacterium]